MCFGLQWSLEAVKKTFWKASYRRLYLATSVHNILMNMLLGSRLFTFASVDFVYKQFFRKKDMGYTCIIVLICIFCHFSWSIKSPIWPQYFCDVELRHLVQTSLKPIYSKWTIPVNDNGIFSYETRNVLHFFHNNQNVVDNFRASWQPKCYRGDGRIVERLHRMDKHAKRSKILSAHT